MLCRGFLTAIYPLADERDIALGHSSGSIRPAEVLNSEKWELCVELCTECDFNVPFGVFNYACSKVPSDKDIFVEAIELNRADRAEFLSTACNGAPGLRERIEMLLQGHDQSDGFLNVPLLGYSTDLFIGMPSDRIGRYKLLEKIGEGGCGLSTLRSSKSRCGARWPSR